MGIVKKMLEKDMMENPELYAELLQIYEDYDFWMQCRKEELLEREGKPTNKIRKGKSNVRKKKTNKI